MVGRNQTTMVGSGVRENLWHLEMARLQRAYVADSLSEFRSIKGRVA